MHTATVPDILYVGYLTGHGGDANQMLLAAHESQLLGYRVKLMVPRQDTSVVFAARCVELGLECERSSLLVAGESGPRQRPLDALRLIRGLKGRVVHFHTGNSALPRIVTSLLLLLWRKRRGVVTIQSPYETFASESMQARWWAALGRRRLTVVSPSDHGREFQARCGFPRDQIATIRNSIDVEAMRGGDGPARRSELGLGAEPLIVFTSRLEAQKRPAEAVEVLRRVSKHVPDAHLVLAGNGSQEAAVSEAAAAAGLSSRVHLMGFRTDVADWLAASTVWLLPTERENFSVAVLEAMAAGCAVVSTVCPGNDEVLEHDVNSLTFEIGDVTAASRSVTRLISDSSLRQRLGDAAAATAAEFTADKMASAYVALYQARGLLDDGAEVN